MSSPARSTVSAASAGAISAADDVADSIDALYRKDEAMAELKSEVMEALQKEVRSLDDDSWMFAAPRSRINLVSMSGGCLRKKQEKLADLGQASKKTRNF
ncbi:protein SAMBA isoform X1 [Oryza brachyantha]|uniref:protein SAMBA isoform X1 n=1 Tax=Oryza brachyantha TaxID=4533 RepID=UPI0003EA96E7|nr:protein SAMBA isoform X1 [Oryza brachyantha]